jgi:hypothetical protein
MAVDNSGIFLLTNYAQTVGSTILADRIYPGVITATPAVGRLPLQALKGDLKALPFYDYDNKLQVAVREYSYSTTSNPTQIFYAQQKDAQGNLVNWTTSTTPTWAGSPNTHAAYSAASLANADRRKRVLAVTGYDLGNIVLTDMPSGYVQRLSSQFPGAFNADIQAKGQQPLPTTGDWHGEGLWLQHLIDGGGNLVHSYLYLLANHNLIHDDYANFGPGILSKFELSVNALNLPSLAFMQYVEVGKNSGQITVLDAENLGIPALGGPQNDGSANPDSGIWTVNVANPDTQPMTATKAVIPQLTGDFRSVAVINASQVYSIRGFFSNNYNQFDGDLVMTTVQNLLDPNPKPWTTVQTFAAEPGNYWDVLAEPSPGRVWLVRGRQLQIFVTLPIISGASPFLAFSTQTLGGGSSFLEFNSAALLPQDDSPYQQAGTVSGGGVNTSAQRLALEVQRLKTGK